MTAMTQCGDHPSISAVVVNFNGGTRTLNCLDALMRQTWPLLRVVVVDNGSEDGSPRQIKNRFHDVEILELGENRGLPAARNIGLSHVTSDLVLLLDNDVYPEPDCLERLVAAWAETRPTVVCPRIRLIPERDVVQADGAAVHFVGTMILRHGYRPVAEVSAKRSAVDACIGACYLLDRERIVEAGGFDEAYFFYFEDLEIALRLRASGHAFLCEPAAVVFHDRGEGTAGLSFRETGTYPARRGYLSMRNRLLTILIHYRLRTLLLLLPALTAYELASLMLALTKGWGANWLKAWLWQIRNAGIIRRRRRIAQSTRVRDDRELLVGGPLPLTPGLIRSRLAGGAVTIFSTALDAYWRLVRPLIG